MTIQIEHTQIDDLVEKAKNKDDYAMENIIKIYHPQIFGLVLFKVKNREDAMDISQDIFINAWKNIHRLKTTTKFKSWLFTIAYNKIRDFYKKKKILTFLGLTKDYENLQPAKDLNGFDKNLEILMTPMSKNEKDIFRMKYMDNLKIIEIASILNKSQSTVKTHLYRSLKKIKKDKKNLKDILEN